MTNTCFTFSNFNTVKERNSEPIHIWQEIESISNLIFLKCNFNIYFNCICHIIGSEWIC